MDYTPINVSPHLFLTEFQFMQPISHLCRAKHSFCPFWVKSCGLVGCMTPSFASSPPSSFSPTKTSQLPSAQASLAANNQNIHILFPTNPLQNHVCPKSEKGRERYEMFLSRRNFGTIFFLIKIAFIPNIFSCLLPETKHTQV